MPVGDAQLRLADRARLVVLNMDGVDRQPQFADALAQACVQRTAVRIEGVEIRIALRAADLAVGFAEALVGQGQALPGLGGRVTGDFPCLGKVEQSLQGGDVRFARMVIGPPAPQGGGHGG
ncbi:hypothetical protein D3C85_1462550 [compost metagenome]